MAKLFSFLFLLSFAFSNLSAVYKLHPDEFYKNNVRNFFNEVSLHACSLADLVNFRTLLQNKMAKITRDKDFALPAGDHSLRSLFETPWYYKFTETIEVEMTDAITNSNP